MLVYLRKEVSMEAKVEGNVLTLKVPLSAGVPSRSSGKTLVVASSNGFMEVPGTDLKLSLNVIKPRR